MHFTDVLPHAPKRSEARAPEELLSAPSLRPGTPRGNHSPTRRFTRVANRAHGRMWGYVNCAPMRGQAPSEKGRLNGLSRVC